MILVGLIDGVARRDEKEGKEDKIEDGEGCAVKDAEEG